MIEVPAGIKIRHNQSASEVILNEDGQVTGDAGEKGAG